MLRSMNDLLGYSLREKDGDIGIVHDFYFDDRVWVIRYLAADTRSWLPGRRVLIAPHAIDAADWLGGWLALNLTSEQVRNSPDLDTDGPVTRQMEQHLAKYYSWPRYWIARLADTSGDTVTGDLTLRSAKEVIGYHITATNGEIGHLEDFVVDDEDWSIRLLVVDTRDWLPARKTIIQPRRVRGFDWAGRQVLVEETREAIRSGPRYDPAMTVRREDETLHPR